MADFATEEGSPGVLFAFWNGVSNGTKDMINKAIMHDMEKHVIIYKVNENGEQILDHETDIMDIQELEREQDLEDSLNEEIEDGEYDD